MSEDLSGGVAPRRAVRILLAEDSEDDAYFFRRALRDSPELEVIWHASDGDEAVRYLRGDDGFGNRERYPLPDVLVLDLKMPRRNGFEVLEWLRGKFPKLKVGVLSSSDEPADVARAEALGAHLYERKMCEADGVRRFVHWLAKMAQSDGLNERRGGEARVPRMDRKHDGFAQM